ncbi:MAG TPA: hypothetical protein VFM05_01660 [Candidatus Saccharimonadales bacterium]|nr:hypothetical protein [Candidatus Saccharimonadales bacterium]
MPIFQNTVGRRLKGLTQRFRYQISPRSFTTRRLGCIFSGVLIGSLLFAYLFDPKGMVGNITAEVIGMCLAALVIELLLVARDEQRSADNERRQVMAVGLCSVTDGNGGRDWRVFLASDTVHKIKDVNLFVRFKDARSESMASVKITQGEFSSYQLALTALVTDDELDEFLEECTKVPDEVVLKWTDMQNVNRERAWPISQVRYVQKSLAGKPDIFSMSL